MLRVYALSSIATFQTTMFEGRPYVTDLSDRPKIPELLESISEGTSLARISRDSMYDANRPGVSGGQRTTAPDMKGRDYAIPAI